MFVANDIWFLKYSSLPSKTEHISQVIASVKFQQSMIFIKKALSGIVLSIAKYIGNWIHIH